MINMGFVLVDVSIVRPDVVAFNVFQVWDLFVVVGDESLDTFASTAATSVAMEDTVHIGGKDIDGGTVMGL